MKDFVIIVWLLCLITLSSCSTSMWWGKEFKAPEAPEQIKTPDFKENIYERTKTLSSNANEMDISNDMLKFLTERMKKVTEENTLDATELQSITEKLDSIVNNNDNNIDKIKENIKPLVDIAYQLNYLETYIKGIEDQNNKILEENRNLRNQIDVLTDKVYTLKSDEQAWYGKLWIAIAILGLIIVVLGVIMVKTMPKSGMAHIGGGILLISLAYFAQKYVWVVAIFGGVGLIGSIAVMIYMLFIHKKAIREDALVNEKFKTEELKKEYKTAHSKTTKDLFTTEKQYLKKKGLL